MDPVLCLILGLVLGVGITLAAQASVSSGWLGKKQQPPPEKRSVP